MLASQGTYGVLVLDTNGLTTMTQMCIYCGARRAETRDHVPPKSFFPTPRPANMITVPCCGACNETYGRDDEKVRNILTSLATTERHPAILNQIGTKRDRSLTRPKGRSTFEHYVKSILQVAVETKGGLYVGKSLAFNLDQAVMDRFFERVARGLLFHTNRVGYTPCSVQWGLSLSKQEFEQLPDHVKQPFYGGVSDTIGKVFRYVGVIYPKRASSVFIIEFFQGFEVITIIRDQQP